MTSLDLPTATSSQPHEIDLVPTPLLSTPTALPRLTGRVSLGTPVVRPLTAAQAAEGDADLRSFLESQAGRYEFLLLSLVCSFRPAPDGAPIVDAGVGIRLSAPGEPADRQPIAWSLTPRRRTTPAVPRSAQLKVSAKLMFVEADLELTPQQTGREELFVVGMGEHDSDPEWRFTAGAATPLVGDEPLALVVRAPAGAQATAEITMAATVRHRRLGLLPYRADLPPTLRTLVL